MKESRFRLPTARDAGVRSGPLVRVSDALDRWFPPRELILRTDGRVSYLAISPRHQKFVAGVLLGFALWGGFATTNRSSTVASWRQSGASSTGRSSPMPTW